MSVKDYVCRVAEELTELGVNTTVSHDGNNNVLTVHYGNVVAEWNVGMNYRGKIRYIPAISRLLEQAGYRELTPIRQWESYKILRNYGLYTEEKLEIEVGAGTRPGWGAKKVAAACRLWQEVVDTISTGITQRNKITRPVRDWSAVLEKRGYPLVARSTHPSQQPWEMDVSHMVRIGGEHIETLLSRDGQWKVSRRTTLMKAETWVELAMLMASTLEEARENENDG